MNSRSFPLERAYRKQFHPGLLDLSSSAPTAPSLEQILGLDATAALAGLSLGYERGGGGLELRAAVASLYEGIGPEHILITAGAGEAIRAVAMAMVRPGQGVLVQQPAYGALRRAVEDAKGVVIPFDAVASLSDDSADLAFANSPYGPEGALLRDLGTFNGRLVVDEVYRPIALTPAHQASCVDYSDRAIAIGDLSKPLGLGGLRIGWIVSKDLAAIEACADALDYLSGSVSALSAHVALDVLPRFDELLVPQIALARQNLMRLAKFVELQRPWVEWTPPQAGYTACLRLRGGAPGSAFFDELLDQGVFMLDGAVFGLPDCLRIGLGMPTETFESALDVLGPAIRRFNARQTPSIERRADVILYTKLPRIGEGKSRLAAGLGAVATANLARAFLEDTIDLARQESAQLYVALATEDGISELTSLLPDACVFNQRGAGMGERLNSAFEDAFARGAEAPVLIGSDSPTLPPHLLGVASKALESHDVVLGPATDGGYYLMGLRAPVITLFNNIDWSTEHTLEQTVEQARAANLSVFFLPPWYDVDTVEDLPNLREDARPGSATAAALISLKRLKQWGGAVCSLGVHPRVFTTTLPQQDAAGS